MNQPKVLGVRSLAIISIIAVCNLRSLSFGALLGTHLVGYYAVSVLAFLLPIGLMTASFATHYPRSGGIYGWIKEAFGPRVGLMAVWLQWLYNVLWYPTQMTFVSAVLLSLFACPPTPYLLLVLNVFLFSVFTLVNLFGMHVTTWALSICATLGTVGPLCLLSMMALWGMPAWVTTYAWTDWLPAFDVSHWGYLCGVTFGLMGIEICGFHVDHVKDPQRVYPRALWWAGFVITVGMTLASLAIVRYVPEEHRDVLTAMIQVLDVCLGTTGLVWRYVVGGCMVLGAAATVLAWLVGPSRGLLMAAREGHAPRWLAYENRYGAPVAILLLQWLGCALLSAAQLLWSVDAVYLFFSAMTTQLALLVYLAYFLAFWVMRYHLRRPECFALSPVSQYAVVGLGLVYSSFVLWVGFVLPEEAVGLSAEWYALGLVLGMVVSLVFLWMISGYERLRD